MEKKRVLFFINTLSGGGAEKILTNIVRYIDKEKFDVTVQTISNEGPYVSEILNLPITYKTIVKDRKTLLGKLIYKILFKLVKCTNCQMIYQIFVKKDYDIEVAFLEGIPTKIIGSTPSNEKTKKIAWVHIDLEENVESDDFFTSKEQSIKTYQNFAKTVFVSKDTKEAFIRKFGINKNLIVQTNVIDSEAILKKADEKIENIEIEKTMDKKVFAIGRLTPQKGFDRLLRVHKRLINEGINYQLYILGEGKDREQLEQYIKENNLSSTVKLLGYQNNPYPYLKQADIFILSSRSEGLPTVIIEALILEKVIVATKCAGVDELLHDGRYGKRVENSEDGIYGGLKLLLQNAKIYNEYVTNVKEAKELFDVNKTIKEVEKIIFE